MRFTAALLLASLAAFALAPQAPATRRAPARKARQAPAPPPASAAADAWPLLKLDFEGLQFTTVDNVEAIAGLKPGQVVGRKDFDAARDRLVDSGVFQSVAYRYQPGPDGKSVVATFTLAEIQQRLPWAIEDLPVTAQELNTRAAKELPAFGPVIPVSEPYFDRVARIISAIGREKGVAEVVAARLQPGANDDLVIVFRPRNPPPQIAEVYFQGAKAVSPQLLQKAIAQVAVGAPYSESMFRIWLENQVRPLYDDAGLLRTQFGKIAVEPSKTATGVAITVEVTESAPYTLTHIEVRGTPLNDEQIMREGGFKTGEVVNFSKIGLGLLNITTLLKNNGYLRAAYKAARRLNDEKKSVELFIDYTPGPQYRMGRLQLVGLDVVSEPVVQKLFAMKRGDPFRNDYPEFFLNEIRARGVFDFLGKTKAETLIHDDTLTVDVKLTFTGAPQGLDSRQVSEPKRKQ
jgi:outer membrane protein assembly factor BamA